MRQILHTSRVNCNFQDICPVYVASGKSETNARTMVVCGTGHGLWCWVIPPKLKSRLPSKSCSVNTSLVIDLKNECRDI